MPKLRNHNLTVVKLSIDSLRLIPNPRVHPDREIEAIIESIKKYGFYAPVFVSASDNTLLAGYARIEALKRLGKTEVDAIPLNVRPEEYEFVMIIDNRLQEMASWNYQLFIETIERRVPLDSVELPQELGMTMEELSDLRRWIEESNNAISTVGLTEIVENPQQQQPPPPSGESKYVEIAIILPQEEWEQVRVELESDLVSLGLKFRGLRVSPPKVRKRLSV